MRDNAYLQRRRQEKTELRNTDFRNLDPEMRGTTISSIFALLLLKTSSTTANHQNNLNIPLPCIANNIPALYCLVL